MVPEPEHHCARGSAGIPGARGCPLRSGWPALIFRGPSSTRTLCPILLKGSRPPSTCAAVVAVFRVVCSRSASPALPVLCATPLGFVEIRRAPPLPPQVLLEALSVIHAFEYIWMDGSGRVRFSAPSLGGSRPTLRIVAGAPRIAAPSILHGVSSGSCGPACQARRAVTGPRHARVPSRLALVWRLCVVFMSVLCAY